MARSILFIDDDESVTAPLAVYFTRHGWTVFRANNGRAGVAAYEEHRPHVVTLDWVMPGLSGPDVLALLLDRDPEVTVIMLTAHRDLETGVSAMRMGADNFFVKPVNLEELEAAATRAADKQALRRQAVFVMRKRLGDVSQDSIGESPLMREVGAQLAMLAGTTSPVLLTGDTGTGKGWAANLVHGASARALRPFVSINCAGLNATFLDTELFGHEKGAFTDAKEAKEGLFEAADGGTIFLDEIGDLAQELQPKLLSVLETNRFRRLGSTREIKVDVRLIAATNKDLRAAVKAGTFREDLFYRLSVLPVHLPTLRERGARDIADLAVRITGELHRYWPNGPARVSLDAIDILARHAWPGNIRELRNVLERARLVAGTVPEIRPEHLPRELRESGGKVDEPLTDFSLAEVTRRHVLRVLEQCGGNRRQAAQGLGITRSTLYRWLHEWGVEQPEDLAAS